jgi:CRP-like cAMP-binding protein
MSTSNTPFPQTQNRLLAALAPSEFQRLSDKLQPISLKLSQVLLRNDELIKYVYFPTTCMISLLTDLEDGSGIEVGIVGNEGMIGIPVILGSAKSTKVVTVQGEGGALRLESAVLKEEFQRGGGLQQLLLRYTNALMAQISQSAACNRRHPVEGRLARWLLMCHDRMRTDRIKLTHQFLGNMLGTRRESVTVSARTLQNAGLIAYSSGSITILDRGGLEEVACECYAAVKKEYDEILGS